MTRVPEGVGGEAEDKYAFELWQDGIMVVEVSGDDLNTCRREIMHYAMMYAQDGPCQIRGASVEHLKPMIDALPLALSNRGKS